MTVPSSLKYSLLGLVLDQAISLVAVRFFPGVVHSSPYFAWGQPPYNWLAGLFCLIGILILSRTSPYYRQAVPFLIAGLLSNGLTFLWFGGYVDVISTGISYTNLADIMIVGGCLWLVAGFGPQNKNPRP